MVTSAIFAPNPNVIMDYLYSSNVSSINDNLSFNSRSNNTSNIPRSSSTTISTTPIVNSSRSRFICVHAASSPIEASPATNNSGSIYVMVTADSKGQLKLLVNRFHR